MRTTTDQPKGLKSKFPHVMYLQFTNMSQKIKITLNNMGWKRWEYRNYSRRADLADLCFTPSASDLNGINELHLAV